MRNCNECKNRDAEKTICRECSPTNWGIDDEERM